MKRLHFFKHPWVARVKYRSAFDEIQRDLGVDDTLNIQIAGRTALSIKYGGKDIEVTQFMPFLSSQPSDQKRWLDFAEREGAAVSETLELSSDG